MRRHVAQSSNQNNVPAATEILTAVIGRYGAAGSLSAG